MGYCSLTIGNTPDSTYQKIGLSPNERLDGSMRLIQAILVFASLAITPAMAKPGYLGACDQSITPRDDFHQYMCLRNDGSIGWINTGSRIGNGDPIFAIANRNTDSAFMIIKTTMAYPGFYCYYDQPGGLNNPTRECIQRVKSQAAAAAERVSADCRRLTISMPEPIGVYKFWEIDEHGGLAWLPAGGKPSYQDGRALRLAGGYDSVLSEAFATLCPDKTSDLLRRSR